MSKVSVIIPVYNIEEYLRECLNSVINQDLVDIEIICINDGSKDNSLEILKEYSAIDNRVIIIDKKNEGVGKARNDGIQKATGDYICFMDSDDYYPNNHVLSDLFNAIKKNNVMVAGGYCMKKECNKPSCRLTNDKYCNINFELKEGINKYEDYSYDYGYTTYLFNRKLIVDNSVFFPSYSRFQDPPFFVKAMYCAEKFVYVDIPTYVYRMPVDEPHISLEKAKDMIFGMLDNLNFAYKKLPKLYYLTAQRLNNDVSNVFEYLLVSNENVYELLPYIIKANSSIDYDYLANEGYEIDDIRVFKAFKFMLKSSIKYNAIRDIKVVKLLRKIIGK